MLVGVGARRGAKGSLAQRAVTVSALVAWSLMDGGRRQQFTDGQTVKSDKGSRASQKQIEVRSPSRRMMAITLYRYSEDVHGREGRQDLDFALVAPLLHMPKCVCRSVLQERGCPVSLSACPSEGFAGGAAAACLVQRHQPVLVPCFRSGRAFFWKDECRCELSVFGTKRDSEGGRDDDMEGPSWQGPMQRQMRASRGPHWNKQSYATGGSSKGDKFHPEFMIAVRDMVGDGWGGCEGRGFFTK